MALEAQDNPFPSLLFAEHVDPSNPSAGTQRLFVDTDHLLKLIDSAGTVTPVGGGIANPLATDSLWDAAGDLVQGSGANTAAKLSAGTAGKVLTSNGAAAALTWETPSASGAMATDALWDAAGDLAQGTGANTGAKLTAGTAGYVLTSNGAAAAVSWQAPASGQGFNESLAAALVNATATGDAGNRSDHFPGSALSGSWSSEATSLPTTVKYGVFSGDSLVAGSITNHTLQAFTPSGAFRIETRVSMYSSTNLGSVGLIVRDSGTGDASGQAVAALYTANTASPNTLRLLTLDTGTYTTRSTQSLQTGSVGSPMNGPWLYIALARNGSNVWTASASWDRVSWVSPATTSKTFTVAKAGFRFGAAVASADFFDVVS